MNHAQAGEVQPQRQGQEPGDEFRVQNGIVFGFRQERFVLFTILVGATAQVLAVKFGIGRVPGNGIELVIAHHRLRCSGIEHFSDDADRFQLPWPAVDEVANKDRGPFRMAPSSQVVPIAHLAQQRGQLVRVAVNVTDNVVTHLHCTH